MIYLTVDDPLFIHAEQLRLFGGVPGIRDLGLLSPRFHARKAATAPI